MDKPTITQLLETAHQELLDGLDAAGLPHLRQQYAYTPEQQALIDQLAATLPPHTAIPLPDSTLHNTTWHVPNQHTRHPQETSIRADSDWVAHTCRAQGRRQRGARGHARRR